MKKKLLLLALLSLLLPACSTPSPAPSGGQAETSYELYYAVTGHQSGPAIRSVPYVLPENGPPPVEQLVAQLLLPPSVSDLASPFPEGTELLSWALEEGVLHLDFSEAYGGLSDIQLTIADYCLTLTLCQLDAIQSVMISVEGVLVPYRHHQILRGSDVILPSSQGDLLYQAVTFYFPREDGGALGMESGDVLLTDGQDLYTAVAGELLDGPTLPGLVSPFPEGTQLLSVALSEQGVCTVDLSAPFGRALGEYPGQEDLLLYSVVNTLGGLEGIQQVQILVEGTPPLIQGTPLAPLQFAPELVESQD